MTPSKAHFFWRNRNRYHRRWSEPHAVPEAQLKTFHWVLRRKVHDHGFFVPTGVAKPQYGDFAEEFWAENVKR